MASEIKFEWSSESSIESMEPQSIEWQPEETTDSEWCWTILAEANNQLQFVFNDVFCCGKQIDL